MGHKYIAPALIERIAGQMRSDFAPDRQGDDSAEVDIHRIALGLGCRVEVVDFEPPSISARVLRTGVVGSDRKYTIQIARGDSPRRQKFSIAHEIAHIVLHDDGSNEFVEFRQAPIDYSPDELYKETQANMLAAALLLPESKIRAVWASSKGVDDVAEFFDVSREAACNRLLNLGLLRDE
jgi:Zn-dependent peptidase ImmA (M78 family)